MLTIPTLRFVECEKWRVETKLDETVPDWEYPEKEEVSKYYPQYYHKTDKVRLPVLSGFETRKKTRLT